MLAFVADRADAKECCINLNAVALLNNLANPPTFAVDRPSAFRRGRPALNAAAARTAAVAPDARSARLRTRSNARRRRQARMSEPKPATTAPPKVPPLNVREAATAVSSDPPSSEKRPSRALEPFSPRTTAAMRRTAWSTETPGTKLMTMIRDVQSSWTGFGTTTFGNTSWRFSCTRARTLASSLKSSSFLIHALTCLRRGLNSRAKMFNTTNAVQ
mmetsp:Transcript_68092/g.210666  ORF Transcript_68092/g.210666 Transcript_68092/m.210666 type:complete len:216 (-) Transcript_68092:902-1549(-)